MKPSRGKRQFSPKVSADIWRRDGGKCVYCGWPSQEIDHVVPFSKGGITDKSNGVCVCRRCNSVKKGKLKMDFITRGLYYLSTVGENTDWVDKVREKVGIYEV